MIRRREETDKEVRRVKALSQHFEHIADEKNDCGQCTKPAITSVDGNHVKNRKQFFEGQVQASEKTGEKLNLPNDTNTATTSTSKYSVKKLEEPLYLKSRGAREICACDVKAKRQIFEVYANGADNNKQDPVKPVETIAQQQKKFYNDILNQTSTSKTNTSIKDNVLEDAPSRNKEYISTLNYIRPIRKINNENSINVDMTSNNKNEDEVILNNEIRRNKSITLDFEELNKKYSAFEEEDISDLLNKVSVDIKEDFTKINNEQETDNDDKVEVFTEVPNITVEERDNNFKEIDSKINETDNLGNNEDETDHRTINENIDEIENFDTLGVSMSSNENSEKIIISQDKDEHYSDDNVHQYNDFPSSKIELNEDELQKDSVQNNIINSDTWEQFADSTKNQFSSNEIHESESVNEDENAENYIASFKHVNNLGENYEEINDENKNEEIADAMENILIFLSGQVNEEGSNGDTEQGGIENGNVNENQNHKDDITSVTDLIEIQYENLEENNEEISYNGSADVAKPQNISPLYLEQNNENIYENIIEVCSLEDGIHKNDDLEINKNSFLYPAKTFSKIVPKHRISEEDYLRNESPSEAHIEECISDVTKAFDSINALCNQPRWHIWDMAKRQDTATLDDLEDDIFGALLDIDSNFCVETYNNGEENILFKIWYGREALVQGSEDDNIPMNSSTNYDGDVSNKTEEEEPEYSFIDDDDDERNDISGTFFDKDENPRIEIIGDHRSNELHIPQLDIPKGQNRAIRKLIESEEIYLHSTKYVIENYLQHFRSLEVSPDIEMVFGNIEEICNETEKIYTSLQDCVSVDEIARTFLTNVHVFDCYIEYMRNKRISHKYANEQFDELIKNRQIELEDQHTCESYLLNVMQRPEQYKTLLEDLKETVTKSGATSEALDEAIVLLDKKLEETNTVLAIDSIKYCPIDLKEMEPFLMKETFNIKKKYKSVVFLFKGGVIFCVEDQDEYDIYDYIESIEMDKLAIRHTNSSMSFMLSCFAKSKRYGDESQSEYNIEAPSMVVKEKWVDEIQRILWCQLQYYKDQQKNTTILPQNRQVLPETYDEENQYAENGETSSTKNPKTDEANEYYAIEDAAYEEEREKMSGIFFDKYENPRIEIIRSESLIGGTKYMGNIPKSQYMIIKELINTEETYLRKMKHIIDSYYLHFKSTGAPSDIQIVFGNIEDIYNGTEKLYGKFLECDSVDDIANVFLDNAHIFDLYTDYMRNKSTSYFYANTKFKELIKARQAELEDQYTCDSYLLNPVQRPGRYKLLLEKLDKELLKTKEISKPLRDAVALANEKITETNTLMTIDSIQKCPINLEKMGPFIMKDSFNIRRKYKSVIFLFKEIVVFCTEDQSRHDIYIYADSIEMTKLTISHNRFSTSFQLRNFDKTKLGEENKYTFDVEAPSMSVKERWMDEIQRLLWGQLQYFKDQQKRTSLNKISPTMSFIRKGSMKDKRKSYDSTTKSRKRSTFYYDIK